MSKTGLCNGLEAEVLYSVDLRDLKAATLFKDFCDVVGVVFLFEIFLSLGI